MTKILRDDDGFTLTELLIAIVIIGILVTTAVASYIGFRSRGEDAGSSANIRAIVPAISSYYGDNSTFVGLTPAALQAYDGSIDPTRYSIPSADLSASSYCVQTTGASVWRKNGPAGSIEKAACP